VYETLFDTDGLLCPSPTAALVGCNGAGFEEAGVEDAFEFAAGIDGNSVRGGEAPGSLGTAGTMPTIPPRLDAADVAADGAS
jgi:hypothetical protein